MNFNNIKPKNKYIKNFFNNNKEINYNFYDNNIIF